MFSHNSGEQSGETFPSVAWGLIFQVLFVLGLEKDFLKLGSDDELGRKIQDAGLKVRQRAPKR